MNIKEADALSFKRQITHIPFKNCFGLTGMAKRWYILFSYGWTNICVNHFSGCVLSKEFGLFEEEAAGETMQITLLGPWRKVLSLISDASSVDTCIQA